MHCKINKNVIFTLTKLYAILHIVLFFCNASFAQTTFIKRVTNLDTSISPYIRLWGTACIYDSGRIYLGCSAWDSSLKAYQSYQILDDTGKSIKQKDFRKDSLIIATSPGSSNMIKTLDGNFAIVFGSRNKNYGLSWTDAKCNFAVLNHNLDTIFTRQFTRPSWYADSIFNTLQSIIQSPIDFSYYLIGYAFNYNSLYPNDSILLIKYDKNGNYLWDSVYKFYNKAKYITGFWINNNIIHISLNHSKYTHIVGKPDFNSSQVDFAHTSVKQIDENGTVIHTHEFNNQSMWGNFHFSKYSEDKICFMGLADTLNNSIYPVTDPYAETQLTFVVGLMDTQFRPLWRYIFPMVSAELKVIRSPYTIKKARDGGILCSGFKTVLNTNITGMGRSAGWLLKMDSAGNMLWERHYILAGADPTAQNYLATFCEADNGDIIATGSILTYPPQLVWLIRLDSMGKLSGADSGLITNHTYLPNILQTFTYPDGIIDIGPFAKELIKVYPNPAQHKVYFLFNVLSNATVTLIDMQGKVVLQSQLNQAQHEHNLDISNIPVGMYNMVISTHKKTYSAKFVKE